MTRTRPLYMVNHPVERRKPLLAAVTAPAKCFTRTSHGGCAIPFISKTICTKFKTSLPSAADAASAFAGDLEGSNPFSRQFADQSFADVEVLLQKKLTQTQKRSVQWSAEILPHAVSTTAPRLLSYVRFEEDPMSVSASTGAVAVQSEEQRRADLVRLEHSVIMNSRPIALAASGAATSDSGKKNVFAISLVAPTVFVDEEDDDDLFGEHDDDFVGKKRKQSAEPHVDASAPYTWVKDFKSDVQNRSLPNTFVFFLSHHGTEASASFLPLKSQIALRKLAATEMVGGSTPQEVRVLRRRL
jgi:hypothetical protein